MSAKIHPTAIIEDGAKIGNDCVIEPFAIIKNGARIGNGCGIGPYVVIEKGAIIGDENKFGPSVYVMGSTQMGNRNNCLHGASIGGGPQDINFKDPHTSLTIGDDNHIGEHATLHRGSTSGKTTIGNGNYLMGNIHVGHDCHLGNQIIMANDSKLGGFTTIEDKVILSAAAGVHQHCRIGQMVIVGALIRVTQDVLPYAMAASNEGLNGLNRIGLKRSGCPQESVVVLKEAYRRFCKNRESMSAFVDWLNHHAKDPYLKTWLTFIETKSHRGFSRHAADKK